MNSPYCPSSERYNQLSYRRCGASGLKLPLISLGCWHNFGAAFEGRSEADWHENCERMIFTAFDLGITHFDLANNYGPPPGSAETRFGRIMKDHFRAYRDELIISTKAGYLMWPGPYGEWGSRKSLLASLDQSLRRMQLDYVDIFYSHRPDAEFEGGGDGTPLEETLAALDHAVRVGKALYTGISSYSGARTRKVVEVCEGNGLAKPIIHQPHYNMMDRKIETDLLPVTHKTGIGVIAFCPLGQGILTDKYLSGIPADSRAGSKTGFLRPSWITPETLAKVKKLNEHAKKRGQSLAQMALAWTLRPSLPGAGVTSALIGASKPGQITENVEGLKNASFSEGELKEIDGMLAG